MRWFTSDTHFAKTGDKILRREMRPYKTIKEYCDDQIRIWNEQASKDDVIYHLGDMCNYNGTEKDFLPGLMLVQEVNAKVILIMGNNEERVMQYCFENNFEKFRDFCIRHGFLDVKQNDTISIEKFFDGFSVGDYVKSPSGPVDILAVRDCDGYPFPYTCATIDEARAIYAACIKAASEPWERKETEETQ